MESTSDPMNINLLPPKKRSRELAFSTEQESQEEHQGESSNSDQALTSNSMISKRVFASKPDEDEADESPPTKRFRGVLIDLNHAEEAEEGKAVQGDSDQDSTVTEQSLNEDQSDEEKELENLLIRTHPSFNFFARCLPMLKTTGAVLTEPILVITEKLLTKSDMGGGQARLAIPGGMIGGRDIFLTPAEKDTVKNGGKLDVTVIGSGSLKEHKMKLVKWDYAKKAGWKYVLNEGWNQTFRDENSLQRGQVVQIWSFRRNENLCIGIVALTAPRSLLKWGRTRPRTPRIPVRQ